MASSNGKTSHYFKAFMVFFLVCPVILPQSILEPLFPMQREIRHTIFIQYQKSCLPIYHRVHFLFLTHLGYDDVEKEVREMEKKLSGE